MPRPPRSKLTQTGAYRPEVIELALLTLAVEGSAKRAASVVKEEFGVGPADGTITKWATDTHNELYLRIREDVGEKIKARVATTVEDQFREGLEVQADVLREVKAKFKTLDARDLPGALRNVATANAILADKLQQMRGGQQITINHELNADELLAKVVKVLGDVAPNVVDAVEVTELPQALGQGGSSEAVSEA
jgi:hypothetical protein